MPIKKKSRRVINTIKKKVKGAIAADKRLRKKVAGMESQMKVRITPPALGSRSTLVKIAGQAKKMKVNFGGANPSSLRNLRGDKKNFSAFRKAAGRRRK